MRAAPEPVPFHLPYLHQCMRRSMLRSRSASEPFAGMKNMPTTAEENLLASLLVADVNKALSRMVLQKQHAMRRKLMHRRKHGK